MAEHAIGNAVKPSLTISERQDSQAWLMWGLQQDMQKIWKNAMLHIRELKQDLADLQNIERQQSSQIQELKQELADLKNLAECMSVIGSPVGTPRATPYRSAPYNASQHVKPRTFTCAAPGAPQAVLAQRTVLLSVGEDPMRRCYTACREHAR